MKYIHTEWEYKWKKMYWSDFVIEKKMVFREMFETVLNVLTLSGMLEWKNAIWFKWEKYMIEKEVNNRSFNMIL